MAQPSVSATTIIYIRSGVFMGFDIKDFYYDKATAGISTGAQVEANASGLPGRHKNEMSLTPLVWIRVLEIGDEENECLEK